MAGRRKLVKVVKRRTKKFLVLRWLDPETDRPREKTTYTNRRGEAERLAAELEVKIKDGSIDNGDILWDCFRIRYEEEHLQSLSASYRNNWGTAANWLENTMRVYRLGDIDTSLLSRFSAQLRKKGKPETTIATYLRPIKAALTWASDMRLIDRPPKVIMPKRAKGVTKNMRSRPVNLEEFERILMAAQKVRPDDYKRWQRLLRGAYESGFRIGELLLLSWDADSSWSLDTTNKYPLIRLVAEGEKSHRDRFQAITPEFWSICTETPTEGRRGPVFPIRGKNGQMTKKRVVRVVSSIGKRAGVITNPTSKKFATSTDIGRRAFATQLGKVLSQAELAEWMRHASPQTTMQYYHSVKAQDLAEKVWCAKGDLPGDLNENKPQSQQTENDINRVVKER